MKSHSKSMKHETKSGPTAATSSAPQSNPANDATMWKDLKAVIEEVRTMMESADRGEIMARYRIGVLVAEVKRSETKYGEQSVAKIAAALGGSRSDLYKYAWVAEAWAEKALKEVLERRTKKGRLPLSWSHLVQLAGVEDGRRRNGLITKALDEDLGVRELEAAIKAKNDEGNVRTSSVSRATDLPCLTTVRSISDEASKLVRNVEAWSAGALEALAAGSDLPDDAIKSLENGTENLEDSINDIAARLTEVKKALADRRSATGGAPGRSDDRSTPPGASPRTNVPKAAA